MGQLERGVKCPTIDTLYKIVTALGVTLPEFFAFDASSGARSADERLRMVLATVPRGKAERLAELMAEVAQLLQA